LAFTPTTLVGVGKPGIFRSTGGAEKLFRGYLWVYRSWPTRSGRSSDRCLARAAAAGGAAFAL